MITVLYLALVAAGPYYHSQSDNCQLTRQYVVNHQAQGLSVTICVKRLISINRNNKNVSPTEVILVVC